MIERVFRLLNVYRAEQGVAAALFLYSFLIGVARVFTLTASQAIFLDKYAAQDLALVYISAAAATMAVSAGYLRLGRVLAPGRLITTNIVVLAGVTAVLWLLVVSVSDPWPAMVLAVWFHVLFSLSNFAFWAAATAVVDIRQGKRLFPVVATGDVVAFSLGGFAILRLVQVVETSSLLLVSAGGMIGALVVAWRIMKFAPGAFHQRRRPDDEHATPTVRPWSSSYLRRLTAYFALSALVFVFVDNAFNDAAQGRYGEVEQLAKFFGTYSAVTAIVNFLFRSFGAGRLVDRFGILAGLAGLPIVVLLGSILVITSGRVFGLPGEAALPVIAFWFMVGTRMGDKIFRGVQYSSMATLYQPLGQKAPAVQATMEGLVDAAAMGGAGLLLLAMNRIAPMQVMQLAMVLVVVCAVWVVVTVLLRRDYLAVLASVLHRRRLKGEAVDLAGEEVVAVVRQELSSSAPENVLYAMELLESANVQSLRVALPHLLEHPNDDVRVDVLRRIERHRAMGALRVVRRLAGSADEPVAVRAAAVRTLCALDDDDVLDPPPLSSDEMAIRSNAMVGLLRSGSIEGIVRAGAVLLHYLESSSVDDRRLAAEVLRETANPSFHRQVRSLLEDDNIDVRREALRAAATCGSPALWATVLRMLRDRETHWQARETLVAGGDSAVAAMVKVFSRAEGDRVLRLAIPDLLGRIGGESAQKALWEWTETTSPEVRQVVFEGLVRSGFTAATPAERRAVDTLLAREGSEAADRFAVVAALGSGDDVGLLVRALLHEIIQIRHRIFVLLSLGQPESDALTAWENYRSDDAKKRAYALEVLDNVLSPARRAQVFPLLEELEVDERLRRLELAVPRVDPHGTVATVADGTAREHHEWTVLCARHLHDAFTGDRGMLADEAVIVEHTLQLRGAELFGEMSDPELSAIAPRFEAMTFEPGAVVFAAGEQGDSLYVVVDGDVHVEANGRTLAKLSEQAVFGEFTVLQSAPRTATVRCDSGARLLRLRQDDLYALLADQPDLARTLVQLVLRRLEENRAARRRSRFSSVSISLKPLE